MTTESASQLTTCLFLGIRLTPDVGMALNQSSEWAQDQISAPTEGVALKKQRFQGKEYLGVTLDSSAVITEDLFQLEKEIRTQVAHYCPKLNGNGLRMYTFAQVLVH